MVPLMAPTAPAHPSAPAVHVTPANHTRTTLTGVFEKHTSACKMHADPAAHVDPAVLATLNIPAAQSSKPPCASYNPKASVLQSNPSQLKPV